MKMRAFWMIGLALLLAGASVFLARDWLDQQTQSAGDAKEEKTVTVVVAKQPLYFGTKVRKEHLRVVNWPAELRPEGTFSNVAKILEEPTEEEARKGEEPQERVALRPIEVGEPILRSKISGFGGRATLSTVISEDMRATTIRVNDVNGVAGFVLPGDRVDVMLTRNPSGGKSRGQNLITDILLQNLKVLAIDQDANQAKDQPKVARAVTLEVTPEQAQKLVLAQQVGFLTLTLRNVADSEADKAKTVSLSDLRIGEANNVDPGNSKKAEKEDKPEPKRTVVVRKKRADPRASVRIVRGTSSTNYQVLPEPSGGYSAPASSAAERPSGVVPRTLWQGSNDDDSDTGGGAATEDGKAEDADKPVSLLEGNSQQGAVQ